MEQNKKKPAPKERRRGLIINVLTLIVLILIVFEGKSLISLFSSESIQAQIQREEEEVFASANILTPETETETEPETEPASEKGQGTGTVASKPKETEPETEEAIDPRTIGMPDDSTEYMDVVVQAQASPIDESYFDDAVFIGDSRMEGFRNFSGITRGSFVTAVGMELENFYTDAQIPTAKGNVAVLDALKNLNFSKVYMMLGTNELGAYDWAQVKENYRKVLADIKTCANVPDPIVYVYSVIYVEEALVQTGDYVNNANVDTINELILDMCREEGYHYINLNEVMSDGYHSLVSGASEDGIHMNQEYSRKWLDYTKTHYLPQV